MRSSNRELWAAFVSIITITLVYLFVMSQIGEIPAASGVFGHGLGVVGFLLMLMTETLYSLRKRSRNARWGRMSSWLRFHIYTGLIGPYMVLLHSSWKFNGLAGIVMLLTIVIVLSGVVGRYIYTAIPRTADGIELEASELNNQIRLVDSRLQEWEQSQPELLSSLTADLLTGSQLKRSVSADGFKALFGGVFSEAAYQVRLWKIRQKIRGQDRALAGELSGLLKRKRTLQRQVATLSTARRLLSLWHTVHIPIGLTLFITAFVHMIGAIYYATLLK
jgi:hypothetical protein